MWLQALFPKHIIVIISVCVNLWLKAALRTHHTPHDGLHAYTAAWAPASWARDVQLLKIKLYSSWHFLTVTIVVLLSNKQCSNNERKQIYTPNIYCEEEILRVKHCWDRILGDIMVEGAKMFGPNCFGGNSGRRNVFARFVESGDFVGASIFHRYVCREFRGRILLGSNNCCRNGHCFAPIIFVGGWRGLNEGRTIYPMTREVLA